MTRPRGTVAESARAAGTALAVAVALAVWATWPLATCLRRCVVDPTAAGFVGAPVQRDVDLIVWILAWGVHALGTRPWALFDAPVFHPTPDALATTEHLLGIQPLYLPVAVASGEPILAHQLALLATFVLAFLAMLALVRSWTGSWIAGATAGVLYAFNAFRANHLPALQIEAAWLLPLVVLAIERVGTGVGRGGVAVLALAVAAQALSSYYLGYATFLVAGVFVVAAVSDVRLRPRAGRIAVAVVAAAVVVGVVSVPYVVARRDGMLATVDPAWAALASARPGKTGATPAVLLAMLTAPWWGAGLAAGRRGTWLVALALAGIVAHALALGPHSTLGGVDVGGPFALASAIVPGWGLIRAPIRLNVVTTLAAAALAGVGVAGVARRLERRSPLAARAVSLGSLALALTSVPFAMTTVPLRSVVPVGEAPPVYAWLARAPYAPVLEVPFHDFDSLREGVDVEAVRMRYGIRHWRPLVGGYSGYVPPSYVIVSALARALPDPRAVELLVRTTGVRWIVVHRAELDRATRRRWAAATDVVRPVAVRGRDVVFTPRTRAAPDLERALLRVAPHATVLGTPRAALPADARRATIVITTPLERVPWLQRYELEVHVTNDGPMTWPSMAAHPDPHLVTLGYRWLGDGRVVDENFDAGRIPWDLRPGETTTARLTIRQPKERGATQLIAGITQDGQWLTAAATQCFTPKGTPASCPVMPDGRRR